MRWLVNGIVGFIIVGLAVALYALFSEKSGDLPGLVACEDAIKATLKSPSSYKRIKAEAVANYFRIEYDAVNSYNAPLRQHGTCSYEPSTGKADWYRIPDSSELLD